MGSSLAYGSSSASYSTDAEAFVDAVNGFSSAGGNGYASALVAGGDRDDNIARMLRLADDPGSAESLRQPDGTYRLEISGIGDMGSVEIGGANPFAVEDRRPYVIGNSLPSLDSGSPLPAGWNMRDASAALIQRQLAEAPSMTAWDGVNRDSPAVAYLKNSLAGLDPVRGDQMQFRVAQSLPDAAANELGGLAVARVLGGGLSYLRSATLSEQALLRSELKASLSASSQGELSAATSLDGLSTGIPVQTYWPPKGGFYGPTATETMRPGYTFNRYGGYIDEAGVFNDLGNYVSPVNVSFGSRALPQTSLSKPLSTYEVIKPIPDVLTGKAAPWFGQVGQGVQHQLPSPVQDLLDHGYIKLVNRAYPVRP